MIGLYFRKAFYETWDNLVFSLPFNFVLTVLAVLGFYFSSFVPHPLLSVCVILFVLVLDGVLATALSCAFGKVSDYRLAGFREFFAQLKASWKAGLCFSVMMAALGAVLAISVPFYFGLKTLYGYVLGGILFWSGIVVLLAAQWFLPVYYRLNKDIKTCVRKSFVLLMDNPGFSVLLFFHSLVLLAISLFLGFLAPGWSAVLLAQQDALRLRMFKYDWLEENAGKQETLPGRKVRVPWKEILADEDENVGHRTLKTFFMPWKG